MNFLFTRRMSRKFSNAFPIKVKGIIFNLLEETVCQEFGDETWDALLEATQLEGVYTSLGNYPDAELMKLVAAASSALNRSPDAVLRWFGLSAMPLLAAKYPIFFTGHTSTRSFLLTLNDVIHKEVRKVYPGADVPEFGYGDLSGEKLVMTYSSARKLCALAEGFIQGAAAHYGEEVRLDQVECMLKGNSRCVFHLSFERRTE